MVDAGLPTSISHGRYSVQKVLGEGGSAFVYKALDTALDREVAIKVLKAESTQTVTNSRFFREAQLAARLVHPNIIAIYDVGTENGHSFIAMELVEGSDLKSLIQSRPPGGLPLPEVLRIARQVCGALEYAHARGVFHCDIKPENVMLARDGTVKLADFGLARALDRPRVSSREGPVGTPSYVAPEVLRGLGQDARSDLYSFGAVIYEMMTGRPPFVGRDDRAVEASQISDNPVPPTAIVAGASHELEKVVLRLLEKQPESRYDSAKDVFAAIAEIPGGEPVNPLMPNESHHGEVATSTSVTSEVPANEVPYIDESHGLENLRRAIDTGMHRASRTVFVTGEAGIGKTRLVGEAMIFAKEREVRCLSAKCFETDRTAPYAPWVQLLHAATEELAARDLQQIPATSNAQVAKLSPVLAARLRAEPAPSTGIPEQDRLQFLEGVSQFFIALSRVGTVFISIDDVNWADPASLDLLAHFVHLARGSRIILVAMYRDSDLEDGSPLSKLVLALARDPSFEMIKLARLDTAGVRELMIGMFDESIASPEFVTLISQKTEGNPFFAEEVLRNLVREGVIYRKSNRWEVKPIPPIEIPSTVRSLIKERLAKFDEETLQTLRVASVIGQEFSFEVLQGISDLDENRLLEILERLVRGAILREEPSERTDSRYRFADRQIRDVLYNEITLVRRRKYHLRVAVRLEQLSQARPKTSVNELALHFLLAGDVQKSVRYSIEAGDQSLGVYANGDALAHFKNALDLLPLDADVALRASVLDRIAKTAYMLARPVEEMASLLEAAEIYERLGEVRRAADFYLRMGRSYSWEKLDAGKATEFEEKALKLLEGTPEGSELADALVTRGVYLALHSDAAAAALNLERGRELSQRFGDHRNEAYAIQYLGLCRRFDDSEAGLREVQRGVELMTSTKAGSVSTAFLLQAEATFLVTGDCASAERLFDSAVEDARVRGLLGHRLVALAELAFYVLGPTAKWDEAAKFASEVIAASPENFAIPRFYAHATLGPIEFARGALSESQHHFERALSLISRASQVSFILPGVVGFARQLSAQSAFTESLETLSRGVELLSRSPPNLLSAMPLVACQLATTEALIGLGRIDQARSVVDELQKLGPAVLSRPWAVAMVNQAEGRVRFAMEDHEAAARALMAASLTYDNLNWKLELAASEFQLAICLEKTGERRRSVEGFQRALSIYSQVGARSAVERILAHLSLLKA